MREQEKRIERGHCGNAALKSLRPWHMHLLSRYEEEKQRPQFSSFTYIYGHPR